VDATIPAHMNIAQHTDCTFDTLQALSDGNLGRFLKAPKRFTSVDLSVCRT
jgi:hypothetical protein